MLTDELVTTAIVYSSKWNRSSYFDLKGSSQVNTVKLTPKFGAIVYAAYISGCSKGQFAGMARGS
jgi:hypothetical protein